MSETKRYLWWNDRLDLPQMNPKYLTENNLWDSTWLKEENPKLWAEREKTKEEIDYSIINHWAASWCVCQWL